MRNLLALLIVGAASSSFAATAQLVVMSTNPNGVPTVGTQYLLGVQVAGLAAPTFLGNNLVTLSGNLGRNTSANGAFYNSPSVVFQSEADTANTIDPANYKRTNDSYFASPWRSILTSPAGAGETATSLFLDGGISNAMPALVSNGTIPFAYVNVTGSPGVLITGTFAIGTEPAPIGAGFGVRLTPGGQLNPQVLTADFPVKNNAVDAGDFLIWRRSFGENAGADADADGDSDGADFLAWQQQFGSVLTPASAATSAVPEPTAALMAATVAIAIAARRRGLRRKASTCRARIH